MKFRVLWNLFPLKKLFQTSSAIRFVELQAYGLNPTGLGKESIHCLASARLLIVIDFVVWVLSGTDMMNDLFTIQINLPSS